VLQGGGGVKRLSLISEDERLLFILNGVVWHDPELASPEKWALQVICGNPDIHSPFARLERLHS
jgi:hypothetical protein